MATRSPQRAPICATRWKPWAGPFPRCRPIWPGVQALNLDAGVLRPACGEPAAAAAVFINGMRRKRAFRRQLRGGGASVERPLPRKSGKYSAEKPRPGKVRREAAMRIAMLHRPDPRSGMSFATGSAAVIAGSPCDEAIQPCPGSKRDSIAPRSPSSAHSRA